VTRGAPLRLLALLALACSAEAPAPAGAPAAAGPVGPLRVVAVNAPLASLARAIGGEAVAVEVPTPPGVDPAYAAPDAETVARVQQADLVLRNGAGYARWLDRASLRQGRVVDTSADFRDALLPVADGVVHRHGPEGEHSHGALAFTVWLDPRLARLQAEAIATAFAEARPSERARFDAGLARVAARLDAQDARLRAASAQLDGAPLLFSHPVYQYPAARYGWNGRSMHWEPDAAPGDAEWRALDALLAEHPARWMLWEAAPLEETRRRLEARGVAPVVFAPGASLPEGEDWLDAMDANVGRLEALPR
jgi:zinc transport system substrate-binding protein